MGACPPVATLGITCFSGGASWRSCYLQHRLSAPPSKLLRLGHTDQLLGATDLDATNFSGDYFDACARPSERERAAQPRSRAA